MRKTRDHFQIQPTSLRYYVAIQSEHIDQHGQKTNTCHCWLRQLRRSVSVEPLPNVLFIANKSTGDWKLIKKLLLLMGAMP